MSCRRFILTVLVLSLCGCRGVQPELPRPLGPAPRSMVLRAEDLLRVSRVSVEQVEVRRSLTVPAPRLEEFTSAIQRAAADELGVDVVAAGTADSASLVCEVTSFEDREGSAVGVEQPATVGAVLELRSSRGVPLWRSNFHVAEQALSENMLGLKDRLKGGARWHSAPEIFAAEVRHSLRELEAQRSELFGVE